MPNPDPPIEYLENASLRVGMMPALGAKIRSLTDLRSGREWLLQSQLPGGEYLPAWPGADFSRFDTSGFDECFPNVGAGEAPGSSVAWPDHGELWSRPWSLERDPHSLVTTLEGQGWPYTFARRISLEGSVLRLDYRVTNHADRPFPHLWSAHPLLKVAPGMKLLLPASLREALLEGGTDPALGGKGRFLPWPRLGLGRDFSIVPGAAAGVAVKLFFPHVPLGWCGILDPATREALTFSWDPEEQPHLGLWLCYGGWPEDGRPGHLTVALEPTSAAADHLRDAAGRGTSPVLAPRGRLDWSLRIRSHQHWTPTDPPGDDA